MAALTKHQLSILKRRVYSANYRSKREYQAVGELTLEQVIEKAERTGWLCYYCRRKQTPGKVSLDHKVPLSQGGSNEIANIVISCQRDNKYKRAMSAEQYELLMDALLKYELLEVFFRNFRPQSYRRYR